MQATAPFGELLKRYRQMAALTQEELAERAGLSVRGIKALEGGERTRPRRDTVRLLAEALGLTREEHFAFEAAARTTLGLDAPWTAGLAESVGDFLGAHPTGPLVAREEEWNHLLLVLDAVGHGVGRVVLLPGEEGVGKTRLAQEVGFEARNRGFLVAIGRCYQPDSTLPFAPFSEVLATLSTQVPPSRWRDLLVRAPALEQLVSDGSVPAMHIEDQVRQMVRDVARLLAAAMEDRPLALLLDSLQWADEGSITLIQHLARTARAQPVLLLGTYRESEIDGKHPLGRLVRDLMREGLAERIAVRRLTPEGTAALVEACIGELDGVEEFVEFVHRRSKGNPFYIKRMLLALGGRYRLVRQIGAGGMGRVFEAVDTESGQTVAAKIMLARTESDVRARLRFEQEGAILATLEHPNIVQVYGTFLEEHASCIVMELLEGRSLGQIAQRPESAKQLPLSRIRQLMLQVVAALSCAHGRGIVHRDIKPDNIIVLGGHSEATGVKVTDFGIARLLRPIDALTTMTSTGMTMGTPLYMAPEQIQGQKVDGRSDLYAVGAVLYQLVTGRPPFEGNDPLTVAIRHLLEAPVAPSTINPEVPRDWDRVILKALAKEPAQRFQSAVELHDAIGTLSTEVSGTRSPLGFWAPISRSWARRPLQVALAATAVVVLALIVIVGGNYPFSSQTHAPPSSPTVASLSAPTPWGWMVDGRGALSAPAAVAVDRYGDVYVANAGNNTVDKFAPNGALVARWGGPGSSVRFDVPSSLAVDRQGHVFVANVGNHHVQELSPAGKVLSVLAPATVSEIRVGFVAVDPGGTVYLFDPSGGGGIVGYAPDANGIVDWSAGLSGLGSFPGSGVSLGAVGSKFSGSPSGFGVDGRGNVYVADSETGYITELGSHGALIRQWRLRALAAAAGGPESLAVDGEGTLYVADSKNNRILKLSPDGRLLASWVQSGSDRTRFLHPSAVATDARGNVYVTNRGSNEIQKLSSRGRLLSEWGRPRLRPARLDNPGSTAADSRGDVFVVTGSSNDHLQEFAPSGRLLGDWGPTFSRSGGPGVARALGSLAGDGQGDVYAADILHNHLLKLSSRGRLLAEWALHVGPISGVAVDEQGNMYVGDSSNSRVLKLSGSGRVLARWATGSFTAPQHLAVDGHGNMYVAYTGENLIQKFSPTGKLVLEWGGSGRGQLMDTADVTVDRQGNVYAVDDATARVLEFSSHGDLRGVWGSAGSQPGQFSNPSSVAVDGHGNVYVADTGNHRIQRQAPPSRS